MIKRPDWDHHSSSAEPERAPTTSKRPVVGQSKPYTSGANARGGNETPRKTPAGAGHIPLAGPYKKD